MPKPPYNSLMSPLATKMIPHEHPRLFGPRSRLQELAREHAEAYARTVKIARATPLTPERPIHTDFGANCGRMSKLISMALVAAVEQDAKLSREAIGLIFEWYVDQPLQIGHTPFGSDVAIGAIVYDFCHEHWTPEERERWQKYFFATRDANVDEEQGPFHDGWWGYKNWGLILGCLAVMYETEKELFMLNGIDRDFRLNAAECLKLAGNGGGYAEGFYVFYYIFEWLVACEAMRWCTGADYYAFVPEFYKQRAIAQMFETYPGIRERGSRRFICVGDGRGRTFKLERDRAFVAQRILAAYWRNDPAHQAVAAFNAKQPRVGADEYSYMDVLFNDTSIKKGNLKKFKLSHYSPGPGYVYARSSWDEDATYLFFKCGKRYTAHQHLDVGHFYIYKHEELAAEGGHYDSFGALHDTNFYLRTIAHNAMLVYDPGEKFEFIRGYTGETGNDGGQAYPWPGTCFRHNGDGWDPDQWRRHPELGDIADMLAFEDQGAYVYTAGDCTRAYSNRKLGFFTRQIVFLRPNTIVVFDRVRAKKPEFKKTWLLHTIKPPEAPAPGNLVVTNGKGRLFVQTVLPVSAQVKLNQGDDLYRYNGGNYPPKLKFLPEAECRIEISPARPAQVDYFLHVLSAADASVASVPQGSAKIGRDAITLTLGGAAITFLTGRVGGSITIKGRRRKLAT